MRMGQIKGQLKQHELQVMQNKIDLQMIEEQVNKLKYCVRMWIIEVEGEVWRMGKRVVQGILYRGSWSIYKIHIM